MPSVRRPIAAVLADAQPSSAGNHSTSETFRSRGRGQQSCLLIDIGRTADVVQLAHVASETGRKRVPLILETWLWATEVEACAAAGDRYGMWRALDTAAETLPTEIAATHELPYIAMDGRPPPPMAR